MSKIKKISFDQHRELSLMYPKTYRQQHWANLPDCHDEQLMRTVSNYREGIWQFRKHIKKLEAESKRLKAKVKELEEQCWQAKTDGFVAKQIEFPISFYILC